ncbi:MAG: HD domain-containing protein [Bacteriovoracaceae bacterium]|nr:HD domain-containing protein [Bacteriovoracaceae bacterium]
MEVRDPVHGSIAIYDREIPILEHAFFQRLRNIKQLGFSEFVFPGATHTRYLHSIGVMNVGTMVFNSLFKDHLYDKEVQRLRQTLRLGCLLHDIGHAPLSHATESVMPLVSALKLPSRFSPSKDRQASHEDYTLKSIVDSSFTTSFQSVRSDLGVTPEAVAELVLGKTNDEAYFTFQGKNWFPIMHQLVSSEMDCDRMDYLLRDSYFCGVSYGKFDLDWIVDNLKACEDEGKIYLGISERAVSTFDDFLLSRFHMFMMVYFHYRAVCLEQMLMRYFKATGTSEYAIPADIEAYLEHDDPHLWKILRHSQDPWAKRVVRNDIPRKVMETFGPTGIPQMEELENYLKQSQIDYIKCSSKGRLSKYYADSTPTNTFPMKVLKEAPMGGKLRHINVNQATDLFDKYSKSHAVTRLHLDFELLSSEHQKSVLKIVQAQ